MQAQILRLLQEDYLPLKASQNKLSVPVIARIYKKMKVGIKFPGVQISQGVIINGHHRYIASLLCKCHIEQVPWVKSPSIPEIQWSEVVLVEEDWDTAAQVLKHNEDDARYNAISVEQLRALLK
jgi:hypothetical protein